MRRLIFSFLIILSLTATIPASSAFATSTPDPMTVEPYGGSVLCPPGVYTVAPDDCLPLGPSEYLTGLAKIGIPWPIRPMPAYSPDKELNSIPFSYFKVVNAGTYLYQTLDAAKSDDTSAQMIGPGQSLYVSYTGIYEEHYLYLRSGGYIRGDGGRLALPWPFQGLLFSSTPRNAFGWVLEPIQSRTAPGFEGPFTDKTYSRFNVVQIYTIQSADGMDWDMVGPDEWLQGNKVRRVEPLTTPPAGVTNGRWIEVDLSEQTLTVHENDQLVFATLIASGSDPYWTKPGLFQIYQKKPAETMSGSFEADRSDYYLLEDVPWTMYYDDKRALHGTYWGSYFGNVHSHGCVNMSLGDSHWLYDWAKEGDWVYVHDPSGLTPTDPSKYGAGAP